MKKIIILTLFFLPLLMERPVYGRDGSDLVQTWDTPQEQETAEPVPSTLEMPTAEPEQPDYLQPMGSPWADTSDAGYCPNYGPHGGFGWDSRLSLPVDGYTAVRPWGWLGPGRGYHGGIDFTVPVGAAVHAAEGGRVVWTGYTSFGFGELVVLAHGGGWLSFYGHLSAAAVSCGQYVNTGGFLGDSGQSGAASTPHLHFEVRHDGLSYNPLLWLGAGA